MDWEPYMERESDELAMVHGKGRGGIKRAGEKLARRTELGLETTADARQRLSGGANRRSCPPFPRRRGAVKIGAQKL